MTMAPPTPSWDHHPLDTRHILPIIVSHRGEHLSDNEARRIMIRAYVRGAQSVRQVALFDQGYARTTNSQQYTLALNMSMSTSTHLSGIRGISRRPSCAHVPSASTIIERKGVQVQARYLRLHHVHDLHRCPTERRCNSPPSPTRPLRRLCARTVSGFCVPPHACLADSSLASLHEGIYAWIPRWRNGPVMQRPLFSTCEQASTRIHERSRSTNEVSRPVS